MVRSLFDRHVSISNYGTIKIFFQHTVNINAVPAEPSRPRWDDRSADRATARKGRLPSRASRPRPTAAAQVADVSTRMSRAGGPATNADRERVKADPEAFDLRRRRHVHP